MEESKKFSASPGGRSCIVAALLALLWITSATEIENREFQGAQRSQDEAPTQVSEDLEDDSKEDIRALQYKDHGADLLRQWHEDGAGVRDLAAPPDQVVHEKTQPLIPAAVNSGVTSVDNLAEGVGTVEAVENEQTSVGEAVGVPETSTATERTERTENANFSREVKPEVEVPESDAVTRDAEVQPDERTLIITGFGVTTEPEGGVYESDVVTTEAESETGDNSSSEGTGESSRGGDEALEAISHVSLVKSVPVRLDDYRKRTLNELERDPRCGNLNKSGTSHVKHRLEPGGEKYNFAAASHGAKLLAANKEAKGASNILNKDKEKYYRSPCSAENKFVVIELSEETLVDTFVLANLEFYSSNLKEFELLGSLNYPTEDWTSLGKFEAGNARHAHSFQLQRPEWVRYLKLKMLKHYNSDFFCTLSMVEVYGIDAIECLMEEWFGKAKNDNGGSSGEPSVSKDYEGSKSDLSQATRLGDSVLKVLMQKVKGLELNQTLFEQYLDELIYNYRGLFGDIDKDMVNIKESVQNISWTLSTLSGVLTQMKAEKQRDWDRLRTELSRHTEVEAAYLSSLRAQVRHMENRETVALTLAFVLILLHAEVFRAARDGFWSRLSCCSSFLRFRICRALKFSEDALVHAELLFFVFSIQDLQCFCHLVFHAGTGSYSTSILQKQSVMAQEP